MNAYDIDEETAGHVITGRRTFILAAPSARRAPAVGKPLQLYVGLNLRRPRLVTERRVTLRARLVLLPRGVLRVTDLKALEAAEGLHRLVEGIEVSDARAADGLPKFAAAAGFTDYDALYAAQLAQEQAHRRRTPHGRVVRELIAWGAV